MPLILSAAGRGSARDVGAEVATSSEQNESEAMIAVAATLIFSGPVAEDLLQATRSLARETRREAGCVSYDVSLDLLEPNRVRLFERWRNQASLKAHFKTPHLRAFRAMLSSQVGFRSVIDVYAIGKKLSLHLPKN